MNSEGIRRAIASEAKELDFQVGEAKFQLVRIPAGEFDMGSPGIEGGHDAVEAPVRHIRISKPFYIGRYEVSQLQYRTVAGRNPSNFRGDDLAMDQITYPRAIEYCKLLSSMVGVNVTLPTEAQWEYSCRAGSKTAYYSGTSVADLDKVAWYEANSGGEVHLVGQKAPNAWGLYDMLGNVWELTLDHIYSYASMQAVDPVGSINQSWGTMRGGGYLHGPEQTRCASRLISNVRFGFTGIRIVINP